MRWLSKAETDALAKIALEYGMIVERGPTAKNGARAGNPIALILSIISGEVATVMLGQEPDERPHAIQALEASGDPVLLDIAAQLRRAAERGREDGGIEDAIEERRALSHNHD